MHNFELGGLSIKHYKNYISSFIFISLPLFMSSTVYALTESEAQAAVASQGKEAVAGNVFIWFLCTIAFLKISQKIDSFMSGLGVNVGHTGGSMMAEALIAARGLGVSGKAIFNKGPGGGSPSGSGSSGGGFLSGGLAGVVGRKITDSAMNAATGKEGGLFGKAAFESSLNSDGDYAKDIISKVATGDIGKVGSITGAAADKALASYLGYGGGTATPSAPEVSSEISEASVDGISCDFITAEMNTDPSMILDGSPVKSAPESKSSLESGAREDIPPEINGDTSISADMDTALNEAGADSVIGSYSDITGESSVSDDSDLSSEISGGGSYLDTAGADSVMGSYSDIAVADATSVSSSDGMDENATISSLFDTDSACAEQELMPTEIQPAGEQPIPLSAAGDGEMPELPEITPDFNCGIDGVQTIPQMPDSQSGLSDYPSSGEAENIKSVPSAVAANSEQPVQTTASGGMPQPQSPENQNSSPIALTAQGSSISASSNTSQTSTAVSTLNTAVNANTDVNSNATLLQQENISGSVLIPAHCSASAPITVTGENAGTIPQPPIGSSMVGVDAQSAAGIPVFSNVEIGGGRITGTETSDKFPGGIEFGMYDAAQYVKPQGDFTTVKTVDGVKWYKQYAAPSLEKTPIVGESGKIKYEEKIANKMPPVPRRKDRM